MGELISGRRRLALTEMQDRAARAAAGLASLGIGQGDLVALYLRNDFPFFEASTAAGLLGAYPTPVNWHYSPDEAAYLFENSGAKAIVIHADLIPPIASALPKDVPVLVVATPPEIARAYGVDAAPVPPGMTDWAAWLEGFEPLSQPIAEAPGTVIYTSGTTGHPKGVRRRPPTPEQAALTGLIIGKAFGFVGHGAPDEIVTVVPGPMYHSAPNAYGLASA